MKDLIEQIISCTKCANVCRPCIAPRVKANVSVMLIARNPGKMEYVNQSEPFDPNTRSGRLLDKQLARIGLTRNRVWITNLVLGYTKDDRPPTEQEIANCAPYLQQQIELVNPKLIVTIGKHASQYFIPSYVWKTDHGKQYLVADRIVIPVTHTGQALRGIYREFEHDFDVVGQTLRQLQ